LSEAVIERPHSIVIWGQFFGVAAIWGSGFLFLKLLITEVSIFQLVLARVGIGAVALVIVMLITGRRWPREITIWLHLTALGVIFCIIPFGLYGWGIQYLPSGLASIFNSVTPLGALLIAIVFIPSERLAGTKLFAFMAAAAGLIVIVSPWLIDFSRADPNYYLGQLACILGSLCYANGGVYTRWLLKRTEYDYLTLMGRLEQSASALMLIDTSN